MDVQWGRDEISYGTVLCLSIQELPPSCVLRLAYTYLHTYVRTSMERRSLLCGELIHAYTHSRASLGLTVHHRITHRYGGGLIHEQASSNIGDSLRYVHRIEGGSVLCYRLLKRQASSYMR